MGDEVAPATSGAGQVDLNNHSIPGVDGNHAVPGPKHTASDEHALPAQSPARAPSNHHGYSPQFDMTLSTAPPTARPGPYNMVPMINALPQVGYRHNHYSQSTQHQYPSTPSPAMMHQIPQMPQFTGSPMPVTNQDYYIQQAHMPSYYNTGQLPAAQAQSNISSRPPMAYYPNHMLVNHPSSGYYYPPTPQYHGQQQAISTSTVSSQYMISSPTSPDVRHPDHALETNQTPQQQRSPTINSDSGLRQSTVRGPPRKPRQSGHAIWIGNLPPQTDLMSLVHHVCQEAPGLESLFLISKSNCAFANFKDEPTCVAAQLKLHDSKFQTVRLVSRLRKSTVEGASGMTAPTGPASTSSHPMATDHQQIQNTTLSDSESSTTFTSQPNPTRSSPEANGSPKQDKFFILKSLTVEDLELSVRTGIWATQSHNEEVLNQAFQSADNVYLVFSANKSGEYFGYARMTSEIDEDPSAAIQFAPKAQVATEFDLPKAIPTDATSRAPKGRIIDDSARGTIFWEADRGDAESDFDSESETGSGQSGNVEDGTQTWGKPFKLEWLSTNRLPFYRTRGLRNPWNSNREVKIARDGTELEPSIGRKLVGLFNRVQSPGPLAASMRVPMGMMPGYVQMRPYGR